MVWRLTADILATRPATMRLWSSTLNSPNGFIQVVPGQLHQQRERNPKGEIDLGFRIQLSQVALFHEPQQLRVQQRVLFTLVGSKGVDPGADPIGVVHREPPHWLAPAAGRIHAAATFSTLAPLPLTHRQTQKPCKHRLAGVGDARPPQ
jgi:hypothetical protein